MDGLRNTRRDILGLANFVGQCEGYGSHRDAIVSAHIAALEAATKVLTEKSDKNPLNHYAYEGHLLLKMMKDARESGYKSAHQYAMNES